MNEKLILLNVRDNLYLRDQFKDKNFDYHNYRDSNIKDYDKTVNYLISKGFSVIRMGRNTLNRQAIDNEFFWDYSYSNIRSDLLDIYLAEVCYACISTGSGFDALPSINAKPLLYVNYLPHGYMMTSSSRDYTCFKKLKDIAQNKIISDLNVLYDRNIFNILDGYDYEKNGFEVVNLTADEILNCTKTFIQNTAINASNNGNKKNSYEIMFESIVKNDKELKILHAEKPIINLINP